MGTGVWAVAAVSGRQLLHKRWSRHLETTDKTRSEDGLGRVLCRIGGSGSQQTGSALVPGSPPQAPTPSAHGLPACPGACSAKQLYAVGLFTVSLRYRQGKLRVGERQAGSLRPSVHKWSFVSPAACPGFPAITPAARGSGCRHVLGSSAAAPRAERASSAFQVSPNALPPGPSARSLSF